MLYTYDKLTLFQYFGQLLFYVIPSVQNLRLCVRPSVRPSICLPVCPAAPFPLSIMGIDQFSPNVVEESNLKGLVWDCRWVNSVNFFVH